MAQIGSYRRIYKQDYDPQFQDMVDTLSITVNDSFETIFDALNNGLTFADNFNATISTFTVTVDQNDLPISPITLKLNVSQKTVTGIIPINVVGTDGTAPNSGVNIGYTINNNIPNPNNTNAKTTNPLTITVKNIKGLAQSKAYTITAIII